MEEDRPLSSDPDIRTADALAAALEALRLAQREIEAAREEPGRWRWVALGLVSALQAALIAALSGYDTARPEDVANPSQPGRVAPIGLLLRRARSSEFLDAPERLDLSGTHIRRLEALIRLRNAAVHGLGFQLPERPGELVSSALSALRHLLVDHAAFNVSRYVPHVTLIDTVMTSFDAFCSSDDAD